MQTSSIFRNNLAKTTLLIVLAVLVITAFSLITPRNAQAIRIGDILDPFHILHEKEKSKKKPAAPVAYAASTAIADQGTLSGVCYSTVASAEIGEEVAWESIMEGGNGTYSYTWSGSDGIKGNHDVVSIVYKSRGMKRATVRVSSGGQILNLQCNPGVEIQAAARTVSAASRTSTPTIPAKVIIASAATAPVYSSNVSAGPRNNSADIAKAMASIRGSTYVAANGVTYTAPASGSSASASVNNTASAYSSLGALSIFSLDKVPWIAIIFIIIIILLLSIVYQLMSKKG